MQATVEISLYPLTENYSQVVTNFILQLKTNPSIKVETNGLSTQIFGDYDAIMALLSKDMKKLLEEQKAVFVLKLAKGELTKENLPGSLK